MCKILYLLFYSIFFLFVWLLNQARKLLTLFSSSCLASKHIMQKKQCSFYILMRIISTCTTDRKTVEHAHLCVAYIIYRFTLYEIFPPFRFIFLFFLFHFIVGNLNCLFSLHLFFDSYFLFSSIQVYEARI